MVSITEMAITLQFPGGATIMLSPAGVTINGTPVSINAPALVVT
jgi:hypothetical protein